MLFFAVRRFLLQDILDSLLVREEKWAFSGVSENFEVIFGIDEEFVEDICLEGGSVVAAGVADLEDDQFKFFLVGLELGVVLPFVGVSEFLSSLQEAENPLIEKFLLDWGFWVYARRDSRVGACQHGLGVF